MTDSEFRNIIRFIVLWFNVNATTNDDFHERICLIHWYMPLVEIKDFNILIDSKPFFD